MKVVFIVRSTLYTVRGGDTVQVTATARALEKRGIQADVKLAKEKIDYNNYDLLHFFNITRPADMLVHIQRSRKPYVLTPIWIDYSLYDRHQRTGITGSVFRLLNGDQAEYVKTIGRFITGRDALPGKSFLWKGQSRSIRDILRRSACLLVNSEREYSDIVKRYGVDRPFAVVPNGIDSEAYVTGSAREKDPKLVLCAARIEGIKNQLNLIRAMNNTAYRLVLAGEPAPGQQAYYEACRRTAAANICFTGYLPREALYAWYAKAKVHVLPSWFELCGLSSLEAAAMDCSVVVSPNGYAKDYFGDEALYCDPGSTASIFQAVEKAAEMPLNPALANRVIQSYNWDNAAEKIAAVYKNILPV